MDKPRWDNWALLVQEDRNTGRVAMNLGPWREFGEIRTIDRTLKVSTRLEAERRLADYLKNEVLYPFVDTSKPYKPVTGYLDKDYHVIVVICEPLPGDPLEYLLNFLKEAPDAHYTVE